MRLAVYAAVWRRTIDDSKVVTPAEYRREQIPIIFHTDQWYCPQH